MTNWNLNIISKKSLKLIIKNKIRPCNQEQTALQRKATYNNVTEIIVQYIKDWKINRVGLHMNYKEMLFDSIEKHSITSIVKLQRIDVRTRSVGRSSTSDTSSSSNANANVSTIWLFEHEWLLLTIAPIESYQSTIQTIRLNIRL
jgi:hypothetical protein